MLSDPHPLKSDSKPWLSVVMPVHRGGAWLQEALASIPARGPGGKIAVIIRDSTPEGSLDGLIDPHRDRLDIDCKYHPDITSWTHKTNMGVEAARSELVCTLHQDDLWLDNRVDVLARLLKAYPDAALYITSATIIDGASKRLGAWRPPFKGVVQSPSEYRDRLLVQNSIAMPSPVWRRDAYVASGGLDTSKWYTPDWDLWLKLADHGTVVFDPEPTVAFRIHGSSLTMTGDKAEMADELNAILARYEPSDHRLRALSRTSAQVNAALARVSGNGLGGALDAAGSIARLGPIGAWRYLHYSRLMERVVPRLRARITGAM